MTTIRDLVEASPIAHETFDYALPQDWVDDVKRLTGISPREIVWWYPVNSTWGQPYPLTPYASYIMAVYAMKVMAK